MIHRAFTPLEKTAAFKRRSVPLEVDGGLMPPLAQTVRERSSLTGFTLIEVIIVVIIAGIIATLGFPAYQNLIEDSRQKVCGANLSAINSALDVYAMEHDTIPADLSEIPEQYLQKAYISLLKQKGGWRIKLAYFIVGQQEKGLAYAGLFTDDLTRGTPNLRRCPAAAAGTRSYGLNSAIKGLTSRQYRDLDRATLTAGDSAAVEFAGEADLTDRHRRYRILAETKAFALAATKGGEIREVKLSIKDKDTEGFAPKIKKHSRKYHKSLKTYSDD